MNHMLNKLLTETRLIQLHYLYSLSILFVISFILSAAFYMQLVFNEIPCPLCLLQRVAFLGICFGIILNLKNGYSIRHEGLTLLMMLMLLIISTRQTLLDIYPRPGHEYIGTTILGLHMPVWSIVISIVLLLAYTLKLCIFGNASYMKTATLASFPKLKIIADFIMWLVILICAMNVIAVFLQCGFAACHTFGYEML